MYKVKLHKTSKYLQKQPPEVFLELSQNSQENTCARVCFLIKLQVWGLQLYLKKRLWHRCFLVNFVKCLRTPFLQNTTGRLLLSVSRGYRYACEITGFFFNVFINHFQKIHRSVLHKITIVLVYFWDVYNVNLWEKWAITVKLYFMETQLKKGYDLRGCF